MGLAVFGFRFVCVERLLFVVRKYENHKALIRHLFFDEKNSFPPAAKLAPVIPANLSSDSVLQAVRQLI